MTAPPSGAPAAPSRARRLMRRVAGLPFGVRLALVIAVVVGGFVAVVVPLFAAGGGTPRAEVAGALPSTVAQGARVRADIAIDNVGDSVIAPVCVAVSGAHLVSADFQGLDLVTATSDRACGGELTGQETIGVTIVLTLPARGMVSVRIVPAQGSTAIGPALVGTVTVT